MTSSVVILILQFLFSFVGFCFVCFLFIYFIIFFTTVFVCAEFIPVQGQMT